MAIATILTHLAPAYTLFCFLLEPNIPEGLECDEISTLYRCIERSFTNSRLNTLVSVGAVFVSKGYPFKNIFD